MISHSGSRFGTFTLAALALGASAAAGCRGRTLEDQDQIGASVGEAMAGLDESLDGRAATAMRQMFQLPDQLKVPRWRRAIGWVLPTAYAASCWQSTFTACDAGVRSRQFADCTLGLATLDGSVTLTFNRPALCAVVTAGDAVTRTATFTLTGPYGGTLDVTSPGGGQTLTKTADGFEYSVGGIRRVLTTGAGRALFDISTQTTSPLEITGSSRADLTIVSGALQVSHNLAGYTVTLTPDNLAWSASCNCAVSGKLTGTVDGGKLSGKSATVELTGCGQANVTVDGETDSVTLDRCATIN
jgi:hypothetical protein